MTDTYLETEADGEDGTGDAVAVVLESVARGLRQAPDECRYDFELVVDEVKSPQSGGGVE